MTSMDAPPQNPVQAQQGQVPQQAEANPQQGQALPQPPQGQALPQTGVQQQAAALKQGQQQQAMPSMLDKNFGLSDPNSAFNKASAAGERQLGQTSPQDMVNRMAKQWGIDVAGGINVENGQLVADPQRLSEQTGGKYSAGDVSARLNYISSALNRVQNEKQQKKAEGALQAGLGEIQSRGRGSLAALTSGFYQDMADLYSNYETEATDFSYFIEKERLDKANQMLQDANKLQKKGGMFSSIGSLVGGVVGTIIAPGVGTGVGAGLGGAAGQAFASW